MDRPPPVDGAIRRLEVSEEELDSPPVARLPIVGVLVPTRQMNASERIEDEDSGKHSSGPRSIGGQEELQYVKEPDFKQTTAPNFRNWETSARKRELQQKNPQPEDLLREYRFWELKLRRGELDPLFKKSQKTWLLDKAAQIPATLQVENARTFWEVKTTTTNGNEKRHFSVPVRERPSSLGPSCRVSLQNGWEKCVRSEEDIVKDVFCAYFENVDEDDLCKKNVGRTLMLQNLRNSWTIEDLLSVLDEIGAENVEYIFLPQGVWETKKSKAKGPRKTRNRAYCFVHFSVASASEDFVDRLSRHELPERAGSEEAGVPERHMSASLAASQGVVANLLRLMDIHNRKWHPRAGALALRLGDSLVPVNVKVLRTLLLDVLKDDPKKAPGCLQKHCTMAFLFPKPASVSAAADLTSSSAGPDLSSASAVPDPHSASAAA